MKTGLPGRFGLVLVLCVLGSIGCRSANDASWEKLGVYKGDRLKKRVMAAREGQREAGERFTDTLARLKELHGSDGAKLEKAYSSLKREYDRCADKAEAVRNRIEDMETFAEDLFIGWEKEIKQFSTPSVQAGSRGQLRDTRSRYDAMHAAFKRTERSMQPVLTQLRDHVLYLKHNLNAQAIASLKGEAANIQTELSRLIGEMNGSITQADEFIKSMPE